MNTKTILYLIMPGIELDGLTLRNLLVVLTKDPCHESQVKQNILMKRKNNVIWNLELQCVFFL